MKKHKAKLLVTTTQRMNRDVIGSDEESVEAEVVGREGTGRYTANVRSGLTVTLSQNFCSVSVNAAIEMPVKIDHPNDDVTARRRLKELDEVVDRHIHKRSRQAQRLLNELARRNR